MMTLSSAPCHAESFGVFSALCTLGSFFSMLMSRTYREVNFDLGCALMILMGKPVVCLLQMSAILDPSPNLPRVCLTPYLVPESTRPSMFGMSSCAIPLPLSLTVTRKNALAPPLFPPPPASALPPFAAFAAALASSLSLFCFSLSVSMSAYSALSLRTCVLSPMRSSY